LVATRKKKMFFRKTTGGTQKTADGKVPSRKKKVHDNPKSTFDLKKPKCPLIVAAQIDDQVGPPVRGENTAECTV